jgi:putative redox protein
MQRYRYDFKEAAEEVSSFKAEVEGERVQVGEGPFKDIHVFLSRR